MKKVFMLLGALIGAAFIIDQVLGKKHIRSRKDDPTIPQISSRVF